FFSQIDQNQQLSFVAIDNRKAFWRVMLPHSIQNLLSFTDIQTGIPHGAGIDDPPILASYLQGFVLLKIKFEELPVFPVGISIGVVRVWVRTIVLVNRKQFAIATLLEFNDINVAKLRCDFNHLQRSLHFTSMIAADFANHDGFFHSDLLNQMQSIAIAGCISRYRNQPPLHPAWLCP
ncbi:MAG: hypothetical protein MI741_20025, partial [Rhodospirillales bacterium]|nr:hypothetical protein [Rhodospirillales bacterium]